MNNNFDTESENETRPLVYIRQVAAADLPDDLRAEIGQKTDIYAVHNEEGERLALVRERALAFALARQNDMTPVAVH